MQATRPGFTLEKWCGANLDVYSESQHSGTQEPKKPLSVATELLGPQNKAKNYIGSPVPGFTSILPPQKVRSGISSLLGLVNVMLL